jgi:Tol biopolymer transport system component
MDAAGKTEMLLTLAALFSPRVSPDGKRVAFTSAGEISVYDPQRNATMRLTFNTTRSLRSIWMPDGKHLVFDQEGGADYSIWWIRSDGSGPPEKLYSAREPLAISSVSPDGRRVAFSQQDPTTQMDLWTLPLDLSDPDHPKPGKPEPFLREPADQIQPAFSPDGRWIAYASFEPTGVHIFVRPFPGGSTAGKWQISTAAGQFPVWSRNGRELFYLGDDNHIMVAEYAAKGDSFNPGRPRQWSPALIARTGNFSSLDPAPDGKRLVVLQPAVELAGDSKPSLHMAVLLNYFDELRRRLPAGR